MILSEDDKKSFEFADELNDINVQCIQIVD